MIGKINNSSSHSFTPLSFDNKAHLVNPSLRNRSFHSIKNVQDSNIDFRVRVAELSKWNQVKNNTLLADIAGDGLMQNQKSRLISLGLAVSLNASLGAVGNAKFKADEIIEKHPKNNSVDFREDNATNKRGQEFIKQFIHTPTIHDETLYAMGLHIGEKIMNNGYNENMVKGFNLNWNQRLAKVS